MSVPAYVNNDISGREQGIVAMQPKANPRSHSSQITRMLADAFGPIAPIRAHPSYPRSNVWAWPIPFCVFRLPAVLSAVLSAVGSAKAEGSAKAVPAR
jgi:hypothetical protein